jgi:vacuolar-type H+-ATPase subunit C/Vma6
MAEGERLDAWCRLRTLPELARARHPEFPAGENFQRRLVQDLIWELAGSRSHLAGAGLELVTWLLARFQVENMKTLLRGMLNQIPLEKLQPQLAVLPVDQALNESALAAAGTIENFAARLPVGRPREALKEMAGRQPDESRQFLWEAALDRGYYQELLARTARLPEEELETIQPLVFQEVNFFQLMLVVRGKFFYGLTAETLWLLRVPGGGGPGGWFKTLLAAPSILALMPACIGVVLDELPTSHDAGETPATVDSATVEALGWNRFLRLANRAFRRSHMGLGAVAGYAAIRRMEVANLVTLSEGVRLGLDANKIRARMIPRTDLEVAHV